MLTTDQVLSRLSEEGITENIQVVRRWIRNGELPAQAPAKRKDGYLVSEADLSTFIEKKRKKQKQTVEDYEAEFKRLSADLDQLQVENAHLREELERAIDREKVLSADLHNALDKLEEKKKTATVDWKRKYDQLLKQGQEKTLRLNQALQEIDILKMKIAEPEKYGVQTKSEAVAERPVLSFTERFQFQSTKYEVKVYTYQGKYSVYLYEGWGRFQKTVEVDKNSPLFKRFLKLVKEKHGVSVEMALASWQQLVPADEVDL